MQNNEKKHEKSTAVQLTQAQQEFISKLKQVIGFFEDFDLGILLGAQTWKTTDDYLITHGDTVLCFENGYTGYWQGVVDKVVDGPPYFCCGDTKGQFSFTHFAQSRLNVGDVFIPQKPIHENFVCEPHIVLRNYVSNERDCEYSNVTSFKALAISALEKSDVIAYIETHHNRYVAYQSLKNSLPDNINSWREFILGLQDDVEFVQEDGSQAFYQTAINPEYLAFCAQGLSCVDTYMYKNRFTQGHPNVLLHPHTQKIEVSPSKLSEGSFFTANELCDMGISKNQKFIIVTNQSLQANPEGGKTINMFFFAVTADYLDCYFKEHVQNQS